MEFFDICIRGCEFDYYIFKYTMYNYVLKRNIKERRNVVSCTHNFVELQIFQIALHVLHATTCGHHDSDAASLDIIALRLCPTATSLYSSYIGLYSRYSYATRIPSDSLPLCKNPVMCKNVC